jgi:uncharacterized protein (DUF433 family)
MIVALQNDPIPLRMDEDGSIRVADTRVLLEIVIEAYENGADPEAIVRSFDSLRLGDVYLVIGYYLNHKEEVRNYMAVRDKQAEEIRREIEAAQPPRPHLRQELLARLAGLRKKDASSGD